MNKLRTLSVITFVAASGSLYTAEPSYREVQTPIAVQATTDTKLSDAEKNALLVDEAEQGNLDKARKLIEAGAHPNYALIAAAEHGHEDIVALALDKGAQVDARICPICTPEYFGFFPAITYAAMFGHTHIVKMLLDHKANPHNYRAITYAAGYGHIEVVRLFIEAKSCFLNEALFEAASSGKKGIVKILLDAGANPNGWRDITNTLVSAAENGHTEVVRLLVASGKMENEYVEKALKQAIFMDKFESNSSFCSEEEEPKKDRTEIIKLLKTAIEQQEDTADSEDGQNEAYQNTENDNAFLAAVKAGETDKVKQLITAGININARDKYGMDALHAAAEKGDLELVKILIDAHIDVKEYGGCALVEAAKTNNLALAKMLIDAGAIDNASAIAYAADEGNVEILKIILDANIFDPTELNWAITNAHGNPSIIALIIRFIEPIKAAGIQ